MREIIYLIKSIFFDQVGDIAVKLHQESTDINTNNNGNEDDIMYLKVSIQLEENIFIVTIYNEDKMNPPYFIDN